LPDPDIDIDALTDGEVEAKFRSLASGTLGAKGCDRVLAEV